MGFSLPNPLNLPDPLNITDHPDVDFSKLNQPTPDKSPVIVTNPFLDNLGIYSSQRSGRGSLVIGLGSYTPAAPASTSSPPGSHLPPDLQDELDNMRNRRSGRFSGVGPTGLYINTYTP